jgi:hypothetical protein
MTVVSGQYSANSVTEAIVNIKGFEFGLFDEFCHAGSDELSSRNRNESLLKRGDGNSSLAITHHLLIG